MIFGKVNSQQPVEIMSLKLSEDATTIVAILLLVYSVSIYQPILVRSPSRYICKNTTRKENQNSGTYHMYEEGLYSPAILKLKSLQNFFCSMGDTAVHTHSGPRSRKRK